MRPVAIIQARMGSTRLPGKVLLPLAGKPALWHVVDRLRQVDSIAEVVVATSDEPGDNAIREFCAEHGVQVFSGSESDVLDRYYWAALQFEADPVVRVTGDCPLVDPDAIAALLEIYRDSEYDHLGIVAGGGAASLGVAGFPDGLGVACVRRSAIDRAWLEATDSEDREHVTSYIWRRADEFRIGYVVPPIDLSALRWTVDHPEDYEFIAAVYDSLYSEEHRPSVIEVVQFSVDSEAASSPNATHVGREKYRHLWRELDVAPVDVHVLPTISGLDAHVE